MPRSRCLLTLARRSRRTPGVCPAWRCVAVKGEGKWWLLVTHRPDTPPLSASGAPSVSAPRPAPRPAVVPDAAPPKASPFGATAKPASPFGAVAKPATPFGATSAAVPPPAAPLSPFAVRAREGVAWACVLTVRRSRRLAPGCCCGAAATGAAAGAGAERAAAADAGASDHHRLLCHHHRSHALHLLRRAPERGHPLQHRLNRQHTAGRFQEQCLRKQGCVTRLRGFHVPSNPSDGDTLGGHDGLQNARL